MMGLRNEMTDEMSGVPRDGAQFDELDAGRRFLLLSQVAVRHEGRALQSLSLSYRQMRTLRHVHSGMTSATELGRVFGVTAPAISETVEALVKRSLLDRAPNERDRRTVKLVLTALGKEMVEEGERIRVRVAEELLSPLSDVQRRSFEEILEALYYPAYDSLINQRVQGGDDEAL